MNITKFSDYTLRVLMFLAAHEGQKITAHEIAATYGISFHHVAKAAQWLAREGYVSAQRGRTGGITLSRAAKDINIGHVLKAAQAGSALVECMRADGGTCCIRPCCGLKPVLAQAQSAFYHTLENFTLADISADSAALKPFMKKQI